MPLHHFLRECPHASDHFNRRTSLPEAVLVFVPTRHPLRHVSLQKGGNHSLAQLADLVQQAYRPIHRRRSRRSALLTKQEQPRRPPCPGVDSLPRTYCVGAPKFGSHDPHHFPPDPVQDSVRARRHVAGDHSSGRLSRLFLRDFPVICPFYSPCCFPRLICCTVLLRGEKRHNDLQQQRRFHLRRYQRTLRAKFLRHRPVWPWLWVRLDCFD